MAAMPDFLVSGGGSGASITAPGAAPARIYARDLEHALTHLQRAAHLLGRPVSYAIEGDKRGTITGDIVAIQEDAHEEDAAEIDWAWRTAWHEPGDSSHMARCTPSACFSGVSPVHSRKCVPQC